jgi:hypothetical protein
MNIRLILSLFLIFSCTHTPVNDSSLKRRRLDNYYVSSSLTGYFMPELPTWANFSEGAYCQRDTSIKYIDVAKMMGSLSLSYEAVLQAQLMYNDEYQKLEGQKHIDQVTLKDEEKLFYEVTQKIQQGIRTFRTPKYKRLNIVWVDVFKKQALKNLMLSTQMSQGHPIFLSFCLSRQGMVRMLKELTLENKNIRLISSELFSVFNSDSKRTSMFALELNKLISKDKKIYFYTQKRKARPRQLKGKFITKYL